MIDSLICFFNGHQMEYVEAKDREKDRGHRQHRDGTEEDIDACTLVDECQRCGHQKEVLAPITIAERYDIPYRWEQ